MAAEDTFAFARTLLAQHTMVFQPTAIVFHHHYETLVGFERQLHGYAVGNVASYAALISRDPKLLLALLRLLPTAIDDFRRDLRRTDSVVRAAKTLPASIRRMQLRGVLKGIPAYLKSVREQRNLTK
jgi:hypothetical protein